MNKSLIFRHVGVNGVGTRCFLAPGRKSSHAPNTAGIGGNIIGRITALVLMLLLPAAPASMAKTGGQGDTILAQGNPPLTQSIVDQVRSLYEYALDIRLSAEQRDRFRRGIVGYWTSND